MDDMNLGKHRLLTPSYALVSEAKPKQVFSEATIELTEHNELSSDCADLQVLSAGNLAFPDRP